MNLKILACFLVLAATSAPLLAQRDFAPGYLSPDDIKQHAQAAAEVGPVGIAWAEAIRKAEEAKLNLTPEKLATTRAGDGVPDENDGSWYLSSRGDALPTISKDRERIIAIGLSIDSSHLSPETRKNLVGKEEVYHSKKTGDCLVLVYIYGDLAYKMLLPEGYPNRNSKLQVFAKGDDGWKSASADFASIVSGNMEPELIPTYSDDNKISSITMRLLGESGKVLVEREFKASPRD